MRHHLAGDEEGHFISQNRRDFAGSDNELKPELLADVEGAKHPMHYYVGIGEFLARLGVQADAPPVELKT